ncbi:DNA-binding protein [uncultured Halomonas sp.]|uniref:DNA-binding protein n=1 Tax=uncultured Halomonas sp. TaxID=173971 RepID=UPI00262F85B6|nr:DNA-binding protein [uncultured Halomonas sp.]
MARPGITYEQVETIADQMIGNGEKPTIQTVRDALGTGSPNTIHRHPTAWRSAQPPVERQATRLPDHLAAAIAQEIERQASAARAEAEASADELRNQVAALIAERDEARNEASMATQEVERLRADLERERTAAEIARATAAEIKAWLAMVIEQRDESPSKGSMGSGAS